VSLKKQSDVKNHLSPRFRTQIHLCEPVSQPDATGFSETEPEAIKTEPSIFAEDFVAEHSTSVSAAAPADGVTVSSGPQAVTNQKSAQA
jgi:hypothetical protein